MQFKDVEDPPMVSALDESGIFGAAAPGVATPQSWDPIWVSVQYILHARKGTVSRDFQPLGCVTNDTYTSPILILNFFFGDILDILVGMV